MPEPDTVCTGLSLADRRVAVVHHWDADGVAAAALAVRNILGAGGSIVSLATPTIGRYSAEAIPPPPSSAEAVLVLDYGIPGDEYEKAATAMERPLYVIDHHRVEPPRGGLVYCNPVAEGRGTEREYPSASLLVYKALGPRGRADALLAALGIVGDLAPFYDARQPHPGLTLAERLAAKSGVGLDALRELAERIDSCYRLLDAACLERSVREAALDPYALLDAAWLAEARERASQLLEQAIERLMELEPVCGFRTYLLEMDALVTSAVGRRLAAAHSGETVALIHHLPSQRGGFIYVRSLSRDISWLHEEARRRGLRAGGKTNVAVVEYSGSPRHALAVLESLCGGARRG